MIVILDNIRSALNVGSIIRTCDAFGIREIYFCGITPEINNPKVKKTSLGAEKVIISKYFASTLEAIQAVKLKNIPAIALETGPQAIPLHEYEPRVEFALVIGNEVSGVSDDVIRECDAVVQIPMRGVKESLNVSVAFGISAFWLTK